VLPLEPVDAAVVGAAADEAADEEPDDGDDAADVGDDDELPHADARIAIATTATVTPKNPARWRILLPAGLPPVPGWLAGMPSSLSDLTISGLSPSLVAPLMSRCGL
jgi:hypothetical protein